MAITESNFAAGAMPSASAAQEFGITPGILTRAQVPGNSIAGPGAVTYDVGTQQPDFNATKVVPNADALKPQTFTSAGGSARGIKYTVTTRTYPQKVSGTADLQHYMVFFINIRGKSKYKTNYKSTPISQAGQNVLQGQGKVNAGAFAIGAGVGAGVGLGTSKLIEKNIGPLSGFAKSVVTGVSGLGGGLVGKALNEKVGIFEPDQSSRIDQAIMLAINKAPEVKYGIDYDGKDLGTLVGFLAGGTSATDQMANQQNAEYARSVAMNIANLPKGIADVFGGDLDFATALRQGMGVAPNPFREQVFRNVQTREFTFEYKFLPRNASEVENVRNIIYQFKFHMHPEVSPGGLFYIYPSTFDIAYYYKGKENTYLNKISTCVLEDMNIDYGGQGWNTFASGAPSEINVKLRFRELEVLTKERIEKGY